MSLLQLTVAEILTFKVALSEQNQQNLHFCHFWACAKFHFFFQIPPFWLKILRVKHIFIFQNFTLGCQAVTEFWWSKVSKNTNFSTKSWKKISKNFSPDPNPWRQLFFLFSFFWKLFFVCFFLKNWRFFPNFGQS